MMNYHLKSKQLAKQGLYVFPVLLSKIDKGKVNKAPLCKWRDQATLTPTSEHFRYANAIGVDCGKSKIVVLDFDNKPNASEVVESFVAKYGELPPTRIHKTITGGYHYIYSIPDNVEITNSASKILEGFDVRGNGGFAVFEGSLGDSAYEVISDMPIAGLPDHLSAILTSKPTPNTRNNNLINPGQNFDLRPLLRGEQGFSEGNRDDGLFRVASKWRAKDYPQELAEEAILILADMCNPPFDHSEALTKVAQAYKYDAGIPQSDAPWHYKQFVPNVYCSYYVDGNQVYIASQDEKKPDVLIMRNLIYINNYFVNEDNSLDVDLRWFFDGKEQSLVFKREDLLTPNKVMKLNGYRGISFSSKAKLISDYFAEMIYLHESRIPTISLVEHFGWTNNHRSFVIGNRYIGDKVEIKRFSDEQDVFESNGTFEKWLEAIKSVDWKPEWQFAALASLACPFTHLVKPNRPNPIIEFFGETASGKTTAGLVVTSVWGNVNTDKKRYIKTFNSTKFAFEKSAALFRHIPLVADESTEAIFKWGQHGVSDFVYGYSDGESKAMGRKDGSVKKGETFQSVCFITGESSLAAQVAKGGSENRVISLEFTRSDYHYHPTKVFSEKLQSNFGLAGPRMIQKIIEQNLLDKFIVTTREVYEKLQDTYKDSNPLNSRRNESLRILHATSLVINKLFCNSAFDVDAIFGFVLKTTNNEKEENNLLTSSFERFKGYLLLKKSLIHTHDFSGKFGYIGRKNGKNLWVIKSEFENFCSQNSYDSLTLRKGWGKNGWIYENSGNTYHERTIEDVKLKVIMVLDYFTEYETEQPEIEETKIEKSEVKELTLDW